MLVRHWIAEGWKIVCIQNVYWKQFKYFDPILHDKVSIKFDKI
jgi:hypothetical protein